MTLTRARKVAAVHINDRGVAESGKCAHHAPAEEHSSEVTRLGEKANVNWIN